LWWRRLLFRIHFLVGAGVGLYVLLIGVTGASLVFRDEMEHYLYRDLVRAGDRTASPDLVSFADEFRRAYPDRQLSSVFMPSDDHPSVIGYLRRDERYLAVFAHPRTGAVIGTLDTEGSFLHWLQKLHFDLLAGRTGRVLNGVGALLLLTLCLTGLVIWWPGKRNWKRSLKVDFSNKWKRVNWDLHSATGFWLSAMLAIWAISGAYFAWPVEFVRVINALSPVSLAKVGALKSGPEKSRRYADLRRLIADAQARSPGASLAGVAFPATGRAHLRIFMAREKVGDYETTDYHYYDPFTGEHLVVWRRGMDESIGDTVVSWLGPLHFGTFGGVGVKILWVVLGLMPPVLFITGALMYWNRSLGKKWMALRQAGRSKTQVYNWPET
jgi:uncharacterized iron-regulated membrane protein